MKLSKMFETRNVYLFNRTQKTKNKYVKKKCANMRAIEIINFMIIENIAFAIFSLEFLNVSEL